MGYEIDIVRRNDYEDFEERSNITLEEWLKYVESDKELKLTNGYFSYPNDTWYESEGYCEWIGHPTNAERAPWFMFTIGSVSAKNPNDETIKKMIRIASSLKAKVVDGSEIFFDESFDNFDDYVQRYEALHNEQENIEQVPIKLTKPWWKFW